MSASFADRLNDAGLVVGKHERDQRPLGVRDQRLEPPRSTTPSPVTGSSVTAPKPAARPHRGMLDRGNEKARHQASGVSASMFASVAPEVKITPAGSRADQGGDLGPRLLDQRAGRPALAMDRRGIAGAAEAATIASRASGRRGAVAFQSKYARSVTTCRFPRPFKFGPWAGKKLDFCLPRLMLEAGACRRAYSERVPRKQRKSYNWNSSKTKAGTDQTARLDALRPA